jgi:peptidoglycan L-alanyl-D-glutamate endopeptidase CwlK
MKADDQITLDRIKLLHPKLRDEALELYREANAAISPKVMLRFAYTIRTFAEQDGLYALGRTKPGKVVTNAKGGDSYHNYGLAFDIVLLIDKDGNGTFETASWDTLTDFDHDGISDWREIVNIAKQYGWACGIDWKFTDAPHFEKTFGYSVKQLYKLFTDKKVDEHNYVKI